MICIHTQIYPHNNSQKLSLKGYVLLECISFIALVLQTCLPLGLVPRHVLLEQVTKYYYYMVLLLCFTVQTYSNQAKHICIVYTYRCYITSTYNE